MALTTYGPFEVVGGEVRTGAFVMPGDVLQTLSTGLVDFGGAVFGIGAPKLSADGDTWTTPSDYPAPSLKKNSLIFRIGTGATFFQGGTDATTVIPFSESGEVFLRTNDKDIGDNSRNWTVTLRLTPAMDAPAPPPREERTAVVLCRLRDGQGGLLPETWAVDFYQQYFFERGTRGLVDYYSDVTHGRVSIVGQAFGWFDIGHTLAEHKLNPNSKVQRTRAHAWGTAAALENGVALASFSHVVIIIDFASDAGAVGTDVLIGHGEGADWVHSFVQHEFGHALGLVKESWATNPTLSPPDGEYQDNFDIMSVWGTTLRHVETILGETGDARPGAGAVSTKNLDGLPPARVVFLPAEGAAATLQLAPLTHLDWPGALAVRIAANPGRGRHTVWVEARHPSNWDQAFEDWNVPVHEERQGDDRSFLIVNDKRRSLLFVDDEIRSTDKSLVVRLTAVHPQSVVVRVWELPTGNMRDVRIVSIVYTAPGDDLAEERVLIRNDRPQAVDLVNWKLHDSRSHPASPNFTFVFPSVQLQPGEDLAVWTRTGANNPSNVFWQLRRSVWNNDGDTAVLVDDTGVEISRFSYP
jgi:hypothetical protein